MMDRTDLLVLGTVGVFITTIFLLLFVFLGTFATGSYSYEYRCIDNVVEKRLNIWGLTPLGGFDPIDGDPAGACKSKGE